MINSDLIVLLTKLPLDADISVLAPCGAASGHGDDFIVEDTTDEQQLIFHLHIEDCITCKADDRKCLRGLNI